MKSNKVYKRVLLLSDMHAPFMDIKFLEQIEEFSASFDPDLIVMPGDITDQKFWSRYLNDTDDDSPVSEFDMTVDCTIMLHDMFPHAEIKLGNHDMRIFHKLKEAGVPSKLVRKLSDVLETPTWTWHTDPRDHMIFNTPKGKVLVRHGDETRHKAINLAGSLGVNVVQGHTHKPALEYQSALGQSVWAMTLGHCMDTASKGARYAFANPIGTTSAFGVIENGNPRIITKD